MIMTNESLNKVTDKNIMIDAWYMDFQIQIKKVLLFNDLPAYRFSYKIGYFRHVSLSTSSSSTREKTGSDV